MPNTSQSSFIPKNNLPNRQKVGRRYNFFFISLVVYGLFIATPVASAVVFIYEKHTQNVINQTTLDLDTAIKSFSESDLLTVTQFDNRLIASTVVLEGSVPVNPLLQLFLQNTPKTVAFTGIQVDALGNGLVSVTAEVDSESFDYVLFYRDELLRNPAFTSSKISDVTYKGVVEESGSSAGNSNESSKEQSSKLSYEVTFTVPIEFFTTPELIDMETSFDSNIQEDSLLDNTNNQ